jgi:hypothetical protein
MSLTVEIPRESWGQWLDDLSKRAREHPVRIEVIDREVGDQEMAQFLPLIGVSLEKEGSEAGEVEIAVASGQADLDHRIEKPARIFVEASDQGVLECLDIEDVGGGKTLVYFEHLPPLPAHLPQDATQQPSA